MIIRVFPRQTSHTPDDQAAFFGNPPYINRPAKEAEINISVTFTWDVEKAKKLKESWSRYYKKVKLGGPAIAGEGGEFTPGLYLKHGITITTRGCPNSCPWCTVKAPFKEIAVRPGHIIQDNNILAASKGHFRKVMGMLHNQTKAVILRGGLEAQRLTDWHVQELGCLRRINELWFACDADSRTKILEKAQQKIKKLNLNRRQLRCYVMIGRQETIEQAEARLETVWDLGFLPFSQLYQPIDNSPRIEYPREWRKLNRSWSRPAAMFAMHKPKPKLIKKSYTIKRSNL